MTYRVRRLEEPCACGQSTTLQIRGRQGETLWVRGKPFDLWELEEILSGLPSRRFWRASAAPDGLDFVVERERDDDRIAPGLLQELERVHDTRLSVDLVPKGTLYDRKELISFGMSGKPIYVQKPLS